MSSNDSGFGAAMWKRELARAAAREANASSKVTDTLWSLLEDKTADNAQTVVDFIVGPTCGLESTHKRFLDSTPLLMAFWANRLDVVQLLLAQHSPNTNAINDYGRNALYGVRGNTMVRCLVEHGTFINNFDDSGQTSLYCAVHIGNTKTVSLLLALGAHTNIPANWTGFCDTPLHHACLWGLVDLAEILLANGASVNALDNDSKTPLDRALERGHAQAASLMRAEGGQTSIQPKITKRTAGSKIVATRSNSQKFHKKPIWK